MFKRLSVLAPVVAFALAVAGGASAAQPEPWQMGFQPAATPSMAGIDSFNDLLNVIITLISIFVLVLLAIIFVRFNRSANPVPSKTSHNTTLEIAWTVVPVIILLVIAVPSFRLLYLTDATANPEMTLKAVGHQWYWSYEYPDHGNFKFDAYMVADGDLKPGQPRLLATDNHVVLPVGTDIRLLITAEDVIHAWSVPAFGVKKDAVPGRTNETWMRIEREGIYYGSCYELCGVNHAYMPITVEAVSKQRFAAWVAEAQKKFAATGPTPIAAGAAPAAATTVASRATGLR